MIILKVVCRILVLLLAFTAVFLFSGCQQKVEKRDYVVGIINPTKALERVIEGFKAGMAGHGYREGRNITYIYDGPLEGVSRVPEIARRMVEQDVDLIYTVTTPVTRIVKEVVAGTDMPVVFGPVFAPVVSGIVDSLAKPGGNLTGIKVRGAIAKGLDWFKAVFPDARRIFIPFHYTDDAACLTLEDLEKAASKLNIELVTAQFSNVEELKAVLESIPHDTDALWLTCSFLLFSNVDLVVAAAAKRKLPVASAMHLQSKGVVIGYGEDEYELGEQVSRIADKILSGESPAVIPVETARYTLRLDLEVAEDLGIHIPNSVLSQADEIIR